MCISFVVLLSALHVSTVVFLSTYGRGGGEGVGDNSTKETSVCKLNVIRQIEETRKVNYDMEGRRVSPRVSQSEITQLQLTRSFFKSHQ